MADAADVERITAALNLAGEVLARVRADGIAVDRKAGGDPVTDADLAVDRALREMLPLPGDGWLSEETADDTSRLACERVWVVDPIDGTKEFVGGIPEWCISVGLVEKGEPTAGGIYNPASGEMILGARGLGVTLNGVPAHTSGATRLDGAVVLASRSEVRRGEWKRFVGDGIDIRATGSVAYKLGLVAVGKADATWTLVPKSEWDVAAGVALLRAAGGNVRTPEWRHPKFNCEVPKLTGLIAAPEGLLEPIRAYLAA